jgi:catechol 2,3-dioxygenase-like lactoylglutathione lyase family enzyme
MSMFTHVTVGTNDADTARAFYDAVFGALGIPGQHTPKGAWYGDPDPEVASGAFFVVTPRNEEPACFANGGTIGFNARSAAQIDAWYAAGMVHGGATKARLGRATSATPPTCATRTVTRSARFAWPGSRPGIVTIETVSEAKSFGGTQGVYRHASSATGTEMTFAVFVPSMRRGPGCRCCGSFRG